MSPFQAAGLEASMTFVITLTLFSSADPDRKSFGSDALALGIAYLVCSLIALPATGASMNPARSLGPAFVTNTWTNHWVYWCGPILGAVLAGLIYEYIFESPRKVPKTKKEETQRDNTTNVREENEAKPTINIPNRPEPVHQGPCFRPVDVPRPSPRGPHTPQCNQQVQSYYCTMPRSGSRSAAYRTWSNEGNSSTQFKF